MTTPTKERRTRTWPDTAAGVGLFAACALLLALIYGQFRGDFTPKTKLTMLVARAGLVMDQGSKVTYNGVSIGRVAGISEVEHPGRPHDSPSMSTRNTSSSSRSMSPQKFRPPPCSATST